MKKKNSKFCIWGPGSHLWDKNATDELYLQAIPYLPSPLLSLMHHSAPPLHIKTVQTAAFCTLWAEGTNILKIKIGNVLAKTRVRALGSMFSSNMAFYKDTSYHVASFAGKDDSQRAMKQWEGIWQPHYNWNRFVTSAPISFACSCLQNTGCACGNHKSSSCPPEEQPPSRSQSLDGPLSWAPRLLHDGWCMEGGLIKPQITQF